MRNYESIIVFSPELSDAQVKQELTRFEGVIAGKGGNSIVVEPWGKRELAYLMKKNKTGRYVCVKYQTDDGSCVETLSNLLRISDSVLKFQSHLLSDKKRKFRGNPKRRQSQDGAEFDEMESSDGDF